jgi:hypothetical protein
MPSTPIIHTPLGDYKVSIGKLVVLLIHNGKIVVCETDGGKQTLPGYTITESDLGAKLINAVSVVIRDQVADSLEFSLLSVNTKYGVTVVMVDATTPVLEGPTAGRTMPQRHPPSWGYTQSIVLETPERILGNSIAWYAKNGEAVRCVVTCISDLQ